MSRPPLPPFTFETAVQKVRIAEDAWNSRDPERVAGAYTEDSRWRNRAEFFQGRAEIVACERALSRFDPQSDLQRVNRSSGEWVPVGERLVEAFEVALRARRETDGRFDPTILPALVAAGYDRSFEQVTPRAPRIPRAWRADARIEIDEGRQRVRIESGAAADLGGIGKGFSATRALEAMRSAWPKPGIAMAWQPSAICADVIRWPWPDTTMAVPYSTLRRNPGGGAAFGSGKPW